MMMMMIMMMMMMMMMMIGVIKPVVFAAAGVSTDRNMYPDSRLAAPVR